MSAVWSAFVVVHVALALGWAWLGLRYGTPPASPTPAQKRALLFGSMQVQAAVYFLHVLVVLVLGASTTVLYVPREVPAVAVEGVVLGLALFALNVGVVRALEAAGVRYDRSFVDALTPATTRTWALLLFGALPVVAFVEETIFRWVLVGVFATGFGVSPWLLVLPAGLAFGAVHANQGPAGVAATTVLGVALAAAFVHTGVVEVAVVAHYVLNVAAIGGNAVTRDGGLLPQ